MVLRDDSTCPPFELQQNYCSPVAPGPPESCSEHTPHPSTQPSGAVGKPKGPSCNPGSWVLGAVESCKSVPGQCHTFKYESFEAFEIFESSQARGIIRIIIRYYTLLYDIIRGIPKNNPRRFRLERISSTTHGVLLAGARCPRKSVLVILATSKWKGCHVALCQDGR